MKRFLIVKPSSLGDVIHAFPAVSMLKKFYPEASVDWLAAPQFETIVRYHPAVDRVIHFRRKELGIFLSFPQEFMKLCSGLRSEKYDAVIDLQGLLRSAAVSFCAKTDLIAGPEKPREKAARLFYGKKLSHSSETLHAVRKNMEMMADFLDVPVPEKADFEMPVNQENMRSAAEKLKRVYGKKLLACAPGARWKSKEWPPAFFAEILVKLQKRIPGSAVVILGSPGEVRAGKEIAGKADIPLLDLTGQTSAGELVEIIRSSEILLCNDSGPMHIASAVGTPVCAFFGPTDPALTGPYAEKVLLFQPELSCIRCFRKECDPCLCHQALDPEKIASSAETFLRENGFF